MSRTKSIQNYPTLNNKGGDLSKDWYVEFSFRVPGDPQLHRRRICTGMRRTVPEQQRYKVAAEFISYYTDYLKSGRYIDDPDDMTPLRRDDTHREELRTYLAIEEKYKTVNIVKAYMDGMKGAIRKASHRKYSSEFKVFTDYMSAHGHEYINQISPVEMQEFFDHLAADEQDGGRNLCRQSIKQYRLQLRLLFEYARTESLYTETNPCEAVRNKGKIVDLAPTPYTADERQRLKEAILPRQPYLWLAIELLYYSAIRPGEARLLKVGDIDRERRCVIIRNEIAKNKRSQQVGLTNDTLTLMERLGVFAYHADLYIFGHGGVPGVKPIGVSTLRERFQDYRRALHIPESRKLYSWKHTGAIVALDNGMDLIKLKDHMRHADVSTTMQYAKKRARDVHAAESFIDVL